MLKERLKMKKIVNSMANVALVIGVIISSFYAYLLLSAYVF